jgi:hypothetical protein
MDIESALFRLIDETLTGFLTCHPDRISIRFEWAADRTEARIAARRDDVEDVAPTVEETPPAPGDKRKKGSEREIPEALRAMIDETRAAKASRAAHSQQPLTLPANTWREVQLRSDTIGVSAQLVDEGREVVLVLPAS